MEQVLVFPAEQQRGRERPAAGNDSNALMVEERERCACAFARQVWHWKLTAVAASGMGCKAPTCKAVAGKQAGERGRGPGHVGPDGPPASHERPPPALLELIQQEGEE